MQHIDISDELEEFRKHLELNRRTIFSSEFGNGKTTFLKEFQEKYIDDVYVVTIHPVNYSIAENKDILEYIKYDILSQIASNSLLIPDIDASAIWKLVKEKAFSLKSLDMAVDFAIDFCPKPEKLKAIKNGILNICKEHDIKDLYDSYNENSVLWKKYEELFKTQTGGLYEQDGYTLLIKSIIEKIQTRTVLVIEDLDRVDPAHLFRLLNVFSAHVDQDNGTNKFGFDNIVLVLDYDVTRKVFQYFYGKEANYEGYMTKFLSHQPFEYSLQRAAHQRVFDYLDKECLLNHSVLGQPVDYAPGVTITLNSIVGHLSVRQVAAALDGIEDMIAQEPFDIHNSIYISPVAPVTKFLALLVRLGCTIRLNNFISALQHNNNPLNFFGGYLLQGRSLNCGAFKYSNGIYQTELTTDENRVTTVKYIMSALTPMDIEIKSDYLEQALMVACDKVKDFRSRQIFK